MPGFVLNDLSLLRGECYVAGRWRKAGHGRIVTRRVTVFHDIGWLREAHNWPGLKAVIMLDRHPRDRRRGRV